MCRTTRSTMLGCFLGLVLLSPAQAEDLIGPEAVWQMPLDPWCSYSDGFEPWIDCITAQGAPSAALEVARHLEMSPPYHAGGIVSRFQELGSVDYAEIAFENSNGPPQVAMVNGDVFVLTGRMLETFERPKDSGTSRLLQMAPQAGPSGHHEIVAHRIMPNNVQRFVITDVLTSECRACEIVGISITHVDFQDGRLIGSKVIGWVAYPNPVPSGWIAQGLLRGDELQLQIQLNLHGYDAGSMDGVSGPKNAAALSEFLAENCLPSSQTLSVSAIRRLSGSNQKFEPASCAP